MRRKGLLEVIALAVVIFIMVGTIATLATQNVLNVGKLIKRENVEIMGKRVESTLYALEAFEDAQVEMDLKGDYRIYEEEGNDYISYTFKDKEGVYQLQPPYGTSFDIKPTKDHEPFDTACLNRTSGGTTIYAGGC
ncbi:MAG: hypothetical protein ABEI58_04100 [Candidatus Nanohaloarchaea archaeon]